MTHAHRRSPAPTGRDAEEASRLFAPGGPLAAYPGPALVLGDDLVAANAAAAPLLGAIADATAGLADAIEAARSGQPAQAEVRLPEGGTLWHFLALPIAAAGAALLLGRDVTAERALTAALVESRRRYKDLAEASGDFAWETGADGRFAFVSPAGALGYRADELVGRRPAEFTLAAEGDDPDFPFLARESASDTELWFRDAAGEPARLVASCRPIRDEAGRWRGTRGVCRDMTATRAMAAELARARHRERLLAYVLRSTRNETAPEDVLEVAVATAVPALAAEGGCVFSLGGGFEPVAGTNPGYAEVLARLAAGEGAVATTVDGRPVLALVTGYAGQANGAFVLWRQAGAAEWSEDDRFLAGELAAQLGTALQQLAQRAALESLSATDPLTGLMNRRGFEAAVGRRLAAGSGRHAVFYIDLDNFKPINDRFGHAAGDAALVAVAELLRRETRPGDLLARMGGDEFALWLEDIEEPAAAAKAAELRHQGGALAHLGAGADRPLAFSIGVALCRPEAPGDLAQLLARADAAMYAEKRRAKGMAP